MTKLEQDALGRAVRGIQSARCCVRDLMAFDFEAIGGSTLQIDKATEQLDKLSQAINDMLNQLVHAESCKQL